MTITGMALTLALLVAGGWYIGRWLCRWLLGVWLRHETAVALRTREATRQEAIAMDEDRRRQLRALVAADYARTRHKEEV